MRKHCIDLLSFFFLGLLTLPVSLSAAEVSFSWLPNTQVGLGGYKIYYGRTSQNYTEVVDVGSPAPSGGRIHGTVSGLEEGVTYFFTATAYANDGRESPYSTEVRYTIPTQNWGPDIRTKVLGSSSDTTCPQAIRETFINIDGRSYEGLEEMTTWSWSSSAPHQPANVIILEADLSYLPTTAQVVDAKLYLYQTDTYGAASYRNSVHKITGHNPEVFQVTGQQARYGTAWNPVPAGTTDNNTPLGLADIAAAESTVTLGTERGYKIWSVTHMVQDWVRHPTTNFGLLIRGEGNLAQETGRTFATSENSHEDWRPKLVVHYRLSQEGVGSGSQTLMILGADDLILPPPEN